MKSFVQVLVVFSLLLVGCGTESSLDFGGNKKGGGKGKGPQTEVFKNEPDKILSKVVQSFYCALGNEGYDVYFKENSVPEVHPKDGGQTVGTYSTENNKIIMRLPEVQFEETSTNIEYGMDLVVSFSTPSLKCHAIGHKLGSQVKAFFKCPTIKYIPSLSYEDNNFEFFESGMVIRKRFKELLKVPDTLVNTAYGVYRVIDGKLYMAFGDRGEERFLSGEVAKGEILINELEPEKGTCKEQ